MPTLFFLAIGNNLSIASKSNNDMCTCNESTNPLSMSLTPFSYSLPIDTPQNFAFPDFFNSKNVFSNCS